MASLLRFLNKPQYARRPASVLRHFWRLARRASGQRVVHLPWGLPLEIDMGEYIGRTIFDCGVFELPVVEAIFRLVSSDDSFLDIGANIGLMSAAALGAGAKSVTAFEPHPDLFRQLSYNVARWKSRKATARQQAISSQDGYAVLHIPDEMFKSNHGVASLETDNDYSGECLNEISVATLTLASVLEQNRGSVGVIKVDIEGHELTMFSASRQALEDGRVRDIIFENWGAEGFDSETSRFLLDCGYTVFGLNTTQFGPVLLDRDSYGSRFFQASRSESFLATRDPQRAYNRMSKHGFECFTRHSLPA